MISERQFCFIRWLMNLKCQLLILLCSYWVNIWYFAWRIREFLQNEMVASFISNTTWLIIIIPHIQGCVCFIYVGDFHLEWWNSFNYFQENFHWLYCASSCVSGGVESDGPPKKLFVAGVIDPASRSSYTLKWELPECHSRRCWVEGQK